MWIFKLKQFTPVVFNLLKQAYSILLKNAPMLILIVIVIFGVIFKGLITDDVGTPTTELPSETTQDTEGYAQEGELSKALTIFTKDYCSYYKVDLDLVYAIMSTVNYDTTAYGKGEDNEIHYGVMSINALLISDSRKYVGKVDIVESAYSNIAYGIIRLEWALENNDSLEGALMAYYHTQPVARKMWAKGVKTTEWVEQVKGAM